MSLSLQNPASAEPLPGQPVAFGKISISGALLLQLGILLGLLFLLYGRILLNLAQQWSDDPNYSHGFFVPICATLLLWIHRKTWMNTPLKPAPVGLIFIFAAMLLLVVGTLGAEVFLPRVSFCILLGGLIVYFAGWPMLRALKAPWLVLFLMIPLPAIIFNEFAFPLQVLATKSATSILDLLHVPVMREGNIIILPSMSLDIVEACSGLRSLMSLITVATFYGLFFERKVWMRCLLVLFAIPVAVFANALRIVFSALLAEYVSHQLAEGFFHAFSGFLLFLLSFAALTAFHTFGTRLSQRRLAT
jgi:exosortase